MTRREALDLRLRRQRLIDPASDRDEYLELFRSLQPVSTLHNTRPGAPPTLGPRADFDDLALTDDLRATGDLLKGRFLGGGVGYVLREDFELYANAFVRPVASFTEAQIAVLEAIRSCGPITPRQIKEETGLLIKEITPALNRLQSGFLVFEEQYDSDWERPFGLLEDSLPEVEIDETKHAAAVAEVLSRFVGSYGVATTQHIRDWSQLPRKIIDRAVSELLSGRRIVETEIDEQVPAFVIPQATGSGDNDAEIARTPESVFMLDRADPLTRGETSELKNRFRHHEVLQYLLIDGDFSGAVLGHWRIGPYDVDDILVHLDPVACLKRRDAILEIVARRYHPPYSSIVRYCGQALEAR